MKNPVPRRVRWAVPVAAGLVSCLHTVAPNVPPSATLRLSEAATGVRGRSPLAVVAAGPRGVIGTANDPGTTLVFNRSMRPVESPSSDPLPGVTVATQDRKPIEGHFRWVGTHGLLFQPAHKLPGSTSFLVTVPRGTQSLDGGRLASEYTLEFSTETAHLSGTFPTNGSSQVHPNDPLFLKFTQPVDPAELQMHLQLTLRLPNEKRGRTLPVSVKSGAPHWAALPNLNPADQSLDYEKLREISDPTGLWLEVVPAQPLPLDSQLELTIAKGLHSTQGPLPTEEPVKVSMRTYGPLRLADVRCARQNLGRCQAHRDFTVVFSSPVHPNDFRRFLKIEGPARPAKPTKGTPNKPLRPMLEHPLALDPDYGDHFKITLRAGLPDLYGQKLEKNVSADLNVEEPFTKSQGAVAHAAKVGESNCDSNDDESSGRGDPNAPRRARLSYNLSVGVRGNILEALSGPGGASGPTAHKIPVSAVNVPTYGLCTKTLSEWSLVRELGKQSGTATENDIAWNWFTPGTGKNIRSVRQLDVAALLDGKPRGAALIALAGLGQLESPVSSLVNLTDLGVSARVSRFGSLVWVTHLSSGAPAAQASVTVYDPNGDIVCADQTDARGLVVFSSQQLKPITRQGDTDSRLLLVARTGDDFTYQRLQPTSSIVVDQPVDYLQKAQWAGFVFTDRGVYRPGEKIKVGGFFRQTAEKGFSVLSRQEYRYTLTDAQGEIIASGDGKLDAFGALSADITLSKSAALGHANVMIRMGRHADETFSGSFEILSYKPAEFKVSVEPRQREVVHQQSVTFDVDSEYLFGSPVSGARVRQHVTRTEVSYAPPGARGYVVDDAAFRQDLRFVTARGSAYAEFTGELDSKGRLSRTITLDAPQQAQAEELVFEADVHDLSQQTQASRSQVLVHPAKFYIALRQPKQRFLAIGAQFPLQALALSPSGKKLPSIPLTLELWRRNWSSVVEDQPADVLHYKTHVRDEKAASCTVTTADREVSCPLRLDEPGYYILRASSKDDLNNPVFASVGIYAVDDRADSKAAPASWRRPDGHKLDLEADQKIYQPGDVARILVKSPFNQATALVTVERAGLLDQKVVQLRGAMPVIDVPIKPEFFPNAYVSVHLLRGRVAAMPEIGAADVGAPDYRVGYTSLRVDPESHRLAVAVSAAHKEYHPGELVDASVALRRPGGAPSAGTVTFYVVDEGVLLLTGYKTPDPLPAFSEPRMLGVYAVESREHLARFIKWRNGERVPILGYEVAEGSNADKGDEVGGGMDIPGRLRSDFKTTVYFESGRAVGADGQATFHFKLPDNLTSFRLMAVAAGSEDRFGFGEGSITTNRPLMARPALPRTLRVGDTLQAGVIVTSKGASGSDVDVSLAARGLTPLGPMQRRVVLPKNGQVEVRFPVKAEAAGQASFEFSAKSGRDADRVRVARKVEQPLRWLTAATTGSTDKAAAVALGNLAGYRNDKGDLTVAVSSSALVGLKSVFEGLAAYPYGCTEQLASRVLPVVAAPKLAEQQQVRLPTTLSSEIDASLGEIAKRQRPDGSFGYWDDDRSVHPWLTAYALLALERASQAGYFVPKRLRDHAVQYLMNVLYSLTSAQDADGNDPEDSHEASEDSDDPNATAPHAEPTGQATHNPREKLRIATAHAAFIADVLARVGQLDQSRLHQLLGFKSSLTLSAKIQLLSAMARLRLPRQQLDSLLADIMKEVTVGANEAHVAVSDLSLAELLESPTRSTALLLQAVLAIDGKHPLAQKFARGLVRLRTGSGYRNTQEDAWALLALEDYRKQEEPEAPQFGAQVFFGDTLAGEFAFRGLPVHSETATIAAEKLLSHPGDPIAVKVLDHGTAHYSVLLRLAKDGASSIAMDEGFSIEKHLRAVEPTMLKQIATVIPDHSELRADLGQLVLVDLLLETAEPREQIVLDDPMPSGLEPVEFGFATSAQSLSSVEHAADKGVSMKSTSSLYGRSTLVARVHREMHDDHVVHFIEHLDPGIHHFRYLARATSPGQFVMPPTRATCMYDTEVFGQTSSSLFEIAAKR